ICRAASRFAMHQCGKLDYCRAAAKEGHKLISSCFWAMQDEGGPGDLENISHAAYFFPDLLNLPLDPSHLSVRRSVPPALLSLDARDALYALRLLSCERLPCVLWPGGFWGNRSVMPVLCHRGKRRTLPSTSG